MQQNASLEISIFNMLINTACCKPIQYSVKPCLKTKKASNRKIRGFTYV
jgi:hypothetical protein